MRFPKIPPTAKLIYKIGKPIKSLLDWFGWSQKVALAIGEGKELPTKSLLGGKLIEQLDETRRYIEAYDLPAFQATIKPLARLPTAFGELRQILQAQVDALQEAADEHAAYADEVVDDLADVVDQLDQLNDWCSSSAEALLELAKAAVFPAIQQELVAESLDLTSRAAPLITTCQAIAREKRKAALTALKAHATAIRDGATELLGALAVEQAALKGEDMRLQAIKDAYAGHETAFIEAGTQLDALRVIVDARRADLAGFEFDLVDQDGKVSEAKQKLQSANDGLQEVARWLANWKSHYSSCPKGNPYDDCTHNDYKNAFLRNEVQPREQRKRQFPDEIRGAENELADARQALAETRALRDRYEARLAEEETQLAEQSRLHEIARAELKTEQDAMNAELWTSKADIYFAASQQGSASIQATSGALE